jgi:hypothetical protein
MGIDPPDFARWEFPDPSHEESIDEQKAKALWNGDVSL